MHGESSMFNNAHHNIFNGTTFVTKLEACKHAKLDELLKGAAPHAILNAGGRADDVRCYPGTREGIIGKMEKWMDGEGGRRNRMMWLSGPAGTGKSAICQTVAESCNERRQHAANFFFFRGDGTRNSAQPLVATLVHQLRHFYPALDKLLIDCMTADSLICKASIKDQFKNLISSPIETIQQSSLVHQRIVLIIDGLDECEDKREQEQILDALHALTSLDHSPFIVLVASRAEPHLVKSFNKLGSSAKTIFLDSKYRPDDDIRRFVVAKFAEIKEHHHLAHTLSHDWPAESDIGAITSKSSGQFLYAATVMRFIEYSSESPYLSLLAVRNMQPSTSYNPLAALDAVYSYIFSKARDIQAVKRILGAQLISESESVQLDCRAILQLSGYQTIEIMSLFADLAAIIKVVPGSSRILVFYHASLDDYLGDQSRSATYHVDKGQIAAELSLICLRNFYDSRSFHITRVLLDYVKLEGTTEIVSKYLLHASSQPFDESIKNVAAWPFLISIIEKLYLETDKAMFKLMLHNWIRFAYIHHIDTGRSIDWQSTSASWYYDRYRAIEWAKFAVGL